MEKKICKTCEKEKSLESFYSCKNCITGRQGSCKMCVFQGRTAKKKEEGKIHPFNKEFRRSDESYYNMAGTTKKDYDDMYDILAKIGYDVWGDVHQQFLDKYNLNKKYPMKYKKRKYNTDNYYLPNGEINPEGRSEKYKKPPTIQ